MFLSDNGGPTRELTSSNLPCRGEKGRLLEGGIRVPFLIRWTGRLPAGHVEDRAISALDIAATGVALAGAKSTQPLDGVNLLPRLSPPDVQPIHEALYWRVGQQAALRAGDWKIFRPGPREGKNDWELYQLSEDIGEAHNLASEHPDQLLTLQRQWEQLDQQMIAPLWGGR